MRSSGFYGRFGKAFLEARQSGTDPFAAIETIVSWEYFAASVAQAQKLAQPEDFDFLHRLGEGYATLRRYAPALLDALGLHAAPAAKPVLAAIELPREMSYAAFYELFALSELKNALRSGDIWVEGSRQFENFNEYLVPAERFAVLRGAGEFPLVIDADCEQYLKARLETLQAQLYIVDQLAAVNDQPDAILTDSGLRLRRSMLRYRSRHRA